MNLLSLDKKNTRHSEKNTTCHLCHPSETLIIKQTEYFSILYDPYPILTGHFLITSRLHYGCGGELTESMMLELMEIKVHLTKILTKHFSSAICYEHGRAGSCLSLPLEERICHHMHLHVLPWNTYVAPMISTVLKKHTRISYADIPAFYNSYGNYVYFEHAPERGFFYPLNNQKIPPHFIRTLLCDRNGTPERADWQQYPDNGLLESTVDFFPKELFSAL